ncbi:hypothetical protein [Streptomyces sp. NPDC051684]|uniref:hypothetical protein n=1 Tax=Streptomyces sp. NPDC051684 TaxID=3365670 RepID=UPI0037A0F397
MSWLKLDDGFDEHPKVVAVGPTAGFLFIKGMCYCGRQLTDGYIPAPVARKLGTKKQIAKLVTYDLWHRSGHQCARCVQPPDGGFVVHDYAAYQQSRAQVEAKRKSDAERQRRHRGASSPPPHARHERVAAEPMGQPSMLREALPETLTQMQFEDVSAGQGDPSRRDSRGQILSNPIDPLTGISLSDGAEYVAEAWTAAYNASHEHPAPRKLINEVRRSAVDLLQDGYGPRQLLELAQEMAPEGWRDFSRHLAARERGTSSSNRKNTAEDWARVVGGLVGDRADAEADVRGLL